MATLEEVTCASPDYIARHGMPRRWDALDGHRMVSFHSSATAQAMPLEFQVGDVLRTVTLPHMVSVSGVESYRAAAIQGLGLIQVPRYSLEEDFARGRCSRCWKILRPRPTPVSLLYPRNRQLSSRVRVFIDWVTRNSPRGCNVRRSHTLRQ